ncbi:P-loop containing nucleoside triphosphate hydrolase protein [Pisolithus croceorrhizus]|nr:P-loop containing nucleoside triphosphate hydrolase protein [Pisolithus croceorrhizus]
MIAVTGNQSAGKSSLIESISGLMLPRSSGTCIRCPTESSLKDERGSPISPPVLPFGEVLSSKSEVEERIRRAQRAILNPEWTLESSGAVSIDEDEILFTPNYFSLDISGWDLADLSFVDHPGLIASVGQSRRVHDIELVKNPFILYVGKPSYLILLTVAYECGSHTLSHIRLRKLRRVPSGQTVCLRSQIAFLTTKKSRGLDSPETKWNPWVLREAAQLE